MSQGLYTSASGIRVNQTSLDVISNNLANVNTTAFKGSKANFATTFYQTYYGGSAPSANQGGSNPIQVGSGTQLSDIAVNQSQGGAQFTGRATDLLINGQGFFLAEQPNIATGENSTYLTRAGNFSLDGNSNLVTADGSRIRSTSSLSGTSPTTEFHVNIPQTMKIAKFIDANSNIVGSEFGNTTAAQTDFDNVAPAGTTASVSTVTLTNFSIGKNGAINAVYSNGDQISVRPNPDLTNGKTELVHRTSEGKVFAAINPTAKDTDGATGQLGSGLEVFTGPTGGNPLEGMQLQIQTVIPANPNGLISNGSNGYLLGANTGPLTYGIPASGSNGELKSGSLESSNIDLSLEFTNLVVAQRGLEANSRMLRAQSEVLQNIIQAV